MLVLAALAVIAPMNILVFSKTAGFRHDSIETGQQMFRELGVEGGFTVTTTEDGSAFTPYNLRKYNAIVFLSTTGDCLTDGEQAAMEEFVNKGGGWIGIHSAADTE